jgi:hypothetical protein
MTAITADMLSTTPRLVLAFEAVSAIHAHQGRERVAAWARASHDDEARIAALAVLGRVPLALNLLADLERARQSGNPRKVAKVNKRLDTLLARLGAESGK